MEWAFVWLMFALKIPIVALLWIVWWAVHQEVEPAEADGGGGIRDRPHPPRRPRRRSRGPHGERAPLPSPPRVRTPARGRTLERDG